MDMRDKILLVEDEADLAMIVADTLRDAGYDVVTAANGERGMAMFFAEKPDLVVADVMMPRMDGFTMARKIRAFARDVPLLFLTARNGMDDMELGFDIGANDYIRKPFELRELIIRIKALLRRGASVPVMQEDRIYDIGLYRFNATTQRLTYGTVETELSYIEAGLLEPLAANIGRTVPASDLMMAVWGRDEESNRNSLHGFIYKLRRALRHDPGISIINQRGYGYALLVVKGK